MRTYRLLVYAMANEGALTLPHVQDPAVMDMFELIATGIADMVYNDLYIKSIDSVKSGNGSSITDMYRTTLASYVSAMKTQVYALRVVETLVRYYEQHVAYVSLEGFRLRMLRAFLPHDYVDALGVNQRNTTTCDVIDRVIRTIVSRMHSTDLFTRTCTEHANSANIVELKDIGVQACLLTRETLQTLMLQKRNGAHASAPPVPDAVAAKLGDTITQVQRERDALAREVAAAKRMLRTLAQRAQVAEARVEERDREIAKYRLVLARIAAADSDSHPVNGAANGRAHVNTPAITPTRASPAVVSMESAASTTPTTRVQSPSTGRISPAIGRLSPAVTSASVRASPSATRASPLAARESASTTRESASTARVSPAIGRLSPAPAVATPANKRSPTRAKASTSMRVKSPKTAVSPKVSPKASRMSPAALMHTDTNAVVDDPDVIVHETEQATIDMMTPMVVESVADVTGDIAVLITDMDKARAQPDTTPARSTPTLSGADFFDTTFDDDV